MAQVVRDFIPAGEEPTAAERDRFRRSVQGIKPGTRVKPDFIPDPTDVRTERRVPREEQLARLLAPKAPEDGFAAALDRALAGREKDSAAETVDHLRETSDFEREAGLFVEDRKEVLDQFPPLSDSAREKFIESPVEGPPENPDTVPEPEEEDISEEEAAARAAGDSLPEQDGA